MERLNRYWKKYKWYIIGYIIYVCFISTTVSDFYEWGKSEYLRLWIIWCIMIPLIAYSIASGIIYYKNKKK